MLVIMIEIREGYYQYVTLIDDKLPISKDNIGYSIYPQRAITSNHLNELAGLFPNEEFITIPKKEEKVLGRIKRKNK